MFQERIEKGVAYLNEAHPGWQNTVDLDRLHMAANCQCIIGQLENGYAGSPTIREHNLWWIIDHGFALIEGTLEERLPQYAILTDEWKETIAALRS